MIFPPTPLYFLEALNGYQKTAVARTAIELDVFTHINAGAQTAEELSLRTGASPRGLRVLCDALVVLRMLRKQDGRYLLTEDSKVFLDRRSGRYLGGAVEFLLSPALVQAYSRFTEAVRRGGTALQGDGLTAPEHEAWRAFARGMGALREPDSKALAELSQGAARVLDVAAGHGRFGIDVLRANPSCSVTALDWAPVLDIAREAAAQAGVADRFLTLPGDAFTLDWGGPYDLIILGHFLHSFGEERIAHVLDKARHALAPEGRVLTLEHVPGEDRTHPSAPAWFATNMLATTAEGDAYPFSEYERMFRTAGFARLDAVPVDGSAATILIGSL